MVLRQAILEQSLKRHPDPKWKNHYHAPLKDESRLCLKHLAAYTTRTRNPYASHQYPLARSAAVLVALFVGRWGDLYVLLSRRSDDLRSYAGDTSLPGGKRDPEDKSPEDTARREAFEEIGLPRDRRRIPLLCTLEPFLSTNNLIVFPVVVLVTDPAIKPALNAPEVAALFSHPLRSLLSSISPFHLQHVPHADPLRDSDFGFAHSVSPSPSEQPIFSPTPVSPAPPSSPSTLINIPSYHTHRDMDIGPFHTCVRIHTFLTGREPNIKPLFGLTAAIVIRVACIGYGPEINPEFDVEAPDQLSMRDRIAFALTTVPSLSEACEREGVEVKPIQKIKDEKIGKWKGKQVKSRL
ncbi:hypothetical protein FRB96_006672 [Tulasnella sp. 330]|nr:hypothetical protein FRB96_006672 [Tulasnella sp. 330]KAG8883269.1 hypothetical protein FRB97_006964 [Tulasnella sp. 331]KAG8888667.1 hypothetical protein FRB98_007228 [Tulasnella sp. 332]